LANLRDTDLDELADLIGYRFTSHAHLRDALTHSSAAATRMSRDGSYERLEFLGDRVLGLAAAELLFDRFPDRPEGELAVRYNALVRKETCAAIAREIGLGRFLRLSPGEELGGGRDKTAILGDALEALIAAIFLDGGYAPAREFVRRYWTRLIDEGAGLPRDAKTTLQEWAQARGLPPPRYSETGRSGPDHAPSFTTSVNVEGFAPVEGQGTTKRAAEQAAAEAFLKREGVWP